MIQIFIGSEIKLFRWRLNRIKFWKRSKWCWKKSICFLCLFVFQSWSSFLDEYMEKPSSFSINYLKPSFESWSIVLLFFDWSETLAIKIFFFIFEIEFIFQFEYYLISFFFSDSKLVSMKINFISFPKFGKRCFWSRFKFMCWTLQQFSGLTSAFEDKCWTILKLMQQLS